MKLPFLSRPANHHSTMSLALVVASSFVVLPGCKGPAEQAKEQTGAAKAQPAKVAPATASTTPEIADGMLAMFRPPLPAEFPVVGAPLTAEMIDLGRHLYFDARLSKNQDLSCNSCHVLDKYGVDGKKTSPGHKGQLGTRNSPTVYNAAGHFLQFWDGRSATVEEQATGPIMNPVEMAMPDDSRVVATVESIPEYVTAFEKAFPGEKKPVSLVNIGRAIGAFERRLVTPAPWDEFLGGQRDALTDEQKRGFLAFMNNGCTACHMGTLLGAGSFQKVGSVKPWPNQADQGRFEATKQEADKMLFKVPSLRNVAETAPYFHDGSALTLEEAIVAMGQHQLGRDIAAEEAKLIASWLRSLTGSLPADYIKAPKPFPSTPKTPKPDPT